MRTGHQRLAVVLLLAAVLSACGSAMGGPGTVFTFSGTSFAGEVPFAVSSGYSSNSTPRIFSWSFASHWGTAAPWYDVQIVIPDAIYAGPGTYACGTDPWASYSANPYCRITVRQSPDGVNIGEWTTYGVRRPDGFYGELPGCTVTIVEDGSRIRGSATCAGLEFGPFAGTHPDAGRTLGLVGSFDVPRFTTT